MFIATETGRALELDGLPDRSFVSVVTLAELRAGVLAAQDAEQRARRLRTLTAVSKISSFPVDEAVASRWAELRAHLALNGGRVNVNDLWIAATAVAHRLPLVTQDADFDPLDGVMGLVVVRV